jgi:murein DD-endopeptidase MepM/ murein hydrolase activator NlpD
VFVVAFLLTGLLQPTVNRAEAVQQTPQIYFTALGDSVASGHGLPGEATDCRISSLSYPVKVGERLGGIFGQELFPLNLACSGATAGLGTDNDLQKQVEKAEKDISSIPASSPILITISIGANNFLRSGVVWKTADFSRENYYNYIDTTLADLNLALVPMIDQLLAHPNVSVLMVTYPSPVSTLYQSMCSDLSSYAPECLGDARLGALPSEDFGRIMTRFDYFVSRLNEVVGHDMYQEFAHTGRIDYTQGLRNAFWGHDCVGLDPWFQCPEVVVENHSVAFIGDFVHPNAMGAQAIADQVAVYAEPLIRAALAPPAPPDASISDPPAPAMQSPGNLPTFHLPWEQGSVWEITVGNGVGEHSNAANYHGFDAVPDAGRATNNVTAVADGVVMDFQEGMPDTALVNAPHAGNCVILDHGGGVYSLYAHLAQDSVPVSVGQQISSGTVIGTMGNSGFSTGPHLHWAVLNSAWMYTDASVSPYQTCSGRTIESRYADPDKELQEDGGIPRTGRYYESFNSPGGTGGEVAAPEPAPATETSVPTETPVPDQVISPIETVSAQDTSDDSSGSGDSAQETWTASVQVNLCDAPPGSGNEMNCQAGTGVAVDISLASGEVMGSCTTGEPQPTPWNTFISTCTVEGLPFNADFVAVQDPSTIPAGYAPANDPLTLSVDSAYPGGGDQATFTFFNVRTDTGASAPDSPGTSATDAPSAPTEVAVATESIGTVDPMSLLPSIADVPGGLVETGRRTRTLPDVVANYTDPAETTQLFMAWEWQGNAVASFALPSGQGAQSGQVNGVYVSIHQFSGADEARAALDFSLTEQAAGTDLQEAPNLPLGEYTRVLYGPTDYGNETTVLTQQGGLLIRVSAAMLDGDPTADAASVTEAILLKASSASTTGTDSSTGSDSSESPIDYFIVGCTPNEACLNATVTVSMEDGQFISSGTCPDTVEITPWGCVVRNVPRDIMVAITIDGIAPGYVAEQNPISWDTTVEPNPYEMPGFTLVPTNASASSSTTESVITADTGGSGEATLLMTFRGCPEGFDPNTGDFWAECTIPLDAPDASIIVWGGDGQGGMSITGLDRRNNGEYVYDAGPGTMSVELSGLAPVVRNAYQVFGADNASGDTYTINLVDGETREVFVFYWYE